MKTQAKDMTKGHPGRLLLQFALPLMLGNIFQQTYTMVDTAVVGQLVGVHALAALGSVDWFNWMSLGICSGLSQGFSIMIAQQFGAKEYEKMKKTVGASLILAVLSAIVVTVVFLLSAAPVLRLMGTREEILGDALLYVYIMFSGILIVMIYNWMSSVLRAIGDSTTPLIAMGVASSSNVSTGSSFCGSLPLGNRRCGSSNVDRSGDFLHLLFFEDEEGFSPSSLPG